MKITISTKQYAEMQKAADEATAAFIYKLPEILYRNLEGALASILGFETDTWNRGAWKVSGGRSSLLSNFLSKKVQEDAQKIIAGLNFTLEPSMVETLKLKFQEDFEHHLKNKIREAAEKKANEVLSQCLSAVDGLEVINVAVTPKQASDPAFGRTPMQKLALAELLKASGMLGPEDVARIH